MSMRKTRRVTIVTNGKHVTSKLPCLVHFCCKFVTVPIVTARLCERFLKFRRNLHYMFINGKKKRKFKLEPVRFNPKSELVNAI